MLQAGDGPDHLFGDGGNDELRGSLGDQYLDGGSGRDTIDFGSGEGIGHGGSGADLFLEAAGADSNNRIDDFRYGTDRLFLGLDADRIADTLDGNGNGRLDATSVRTGDLTIDLTVPHNDGVDRGT